MVTEGGGSGKHRLSDEMRRVAEREGLSVRTAKSYIYWCRKYWLFHKKRNPVELKADHIHQFLTHLAMYKKVSASTQNLAQCALLFLYRKVLKKPLPVSGRAIWARRKRNVPAILTRSETSALLNALSGPNKLMAGLLYGSGLRLTECMRLRVRDIDLDNGRITVRDTRNDRLRLTMLPSVLHGRMQRHLARVRLLYEEDLAEGWNAQPAGAWEQQYVFAAVRNSNDSNELRTHLSGQSLQRAVKRALRKAEIRKEASCQTLRHSFAAHLLEDGHDIRTVQELMGHKNVRTTLIYAQIVAHTAARIVSPLDSG